MLRLDAVRSGYRGRPVLLGAGLELGEGASLAVLGRNGVGKSTLMRTIIGHLAVSAGEVLLDDRLLNRLSAHERARAGIAFVPQGRGIFSGLSVVENLRVAAQAIFGRGWRAHVEDILAEFPALSERRHQPGESLSGGQQQILAIARALISQPRLLLLDEPSEGIAPAVLDEIAELVTSVRQQRGLSVLIAEQNIDFAARIAADGFVLERGRLDTPVRLHELRDSPELQRRVLAV